MNTTHTHPSSVKTCCYRCGSTLTNPIAIRQANYDFARGSMVLTCCDRCAELKPGPDGSEDGDFACDPDTY